MRQGWKAVLVVTGGLFVVGCRSETTSEQPGETASPAAIADSVIRVEAAHAAEFWHQFPEGKENGNGAKGSIRCVPVAGQPFYGFDGDSHASETEYLGTTKSIRFATRLLRHQDGNDVYEVTRTVTIKVEEDGRIRESTGAPQTVTVAYGGQPEVLFDDEYGVAGIRPVRPQAAQTDSSE